MLYGPTCCELVAQPAAAEAAWGSGKTAEATVRVSGIPPEMSQMDVKDMFATCGQVVRVDLDRSHYSGGSTPKSAAVVYDTPASADLAVLIAALVVVLIVACAAVALAGYTVWKHHKARRDEPTWRDIQRAMEEARNPVYRDVASPKDALEVEGDFEAQPLGVRGSRAWSPLTTEQSRGVELVDLKEDDSPSVDVDLLT